MQAGDFLPHRVLDSGHFTQAYIVMRKGMSAVTEIITAEPISHDAAAWFITEIAVTLSQASEAAERHVVFLHIPDGIVHQALHVAFPAAVRMDRHAAYGGACKRTAAKMECYGQRADDRLDFPFLKGQKMA